MYISRLIKSDKTGEELCKFTKAELEETGYSVENLYIGLSENYERLLETAAEVRGADENVDYEKIRRDLNISETCRHSTMMEF